MNGLSIIQLGKESNSLEIGSSRESKHSPCNGHAKSLQNAKFQLKKIKSYSPSSCNPFINFMRPPKVEFPSMRFLQLILVV